jgi:predicted nuclease with TOPRIM domain
MQFGSPEFVLAIIGMAMFAGVMKTAVRAKQGLSDFPTGRHSRRELRHQRDEKPGQVETLKSENKRLTDQVETMQDRLIVLEKIVTDRGYTLASEIEALRDRPGRIEQGSDV